MIDRGTLPTGQWVELDGTLLRVGTSDAADVQPIVDALREAGLIIRRLQLVRPSLEDLFLEAVSHHASDSRPAPVESSRIGAAAAVSA
jgi:hypothetical protein